MSFLLDNIRRFVLILAVLYALALFYISGTSGASLAGWGELGRLYARTAVILIYVTLLATPLTQQFPNLPYRILYIKARRAIGVSAFFYGLMHGAISFFIVLGGWSGITQLPRLALFAIGASTTALLILALLAATSFDYMVRRLGTRWKILHRFVYLAGALIIFHAVVMGDLSFMYLPLAILFILETMRFIRYVQRRRSLKAQKSTYRNPADLGL